MKIISQLIVLVLWSNLIYVLRKGDRWIGSCNEFALVPPRVEKDCKILQFAVRRVIADSAMSSIQFV